MFEMLLGHLAGDYIFQNEWLALNKGKNTKIGWLATIIHCVIYTLCVCTFMWNFNYIWIVAVFLSHFPIDKFGLAELYMTKVKGYGLKQYINDVNLNTKWVFMENTKGHQMIKGGFTAIVYVITDNTLHLILMWFAYKIIF